jgi:hypothetical protein
MPVLLCTNMNRNGRERLSRLGSDHTLSSGPQESSSVARQLEVGYRFVLF